MKDSEKRILLAHSYPWISEMQAEGFTYLDILQALEDGKVLSFYGISQEKAEDMHSDLKKFIDSSIQTKNYCGASIAEAVEMFAPKWEK